MTNTDDKQNPAPRSDGVSPDDSRVSWRDMTTAADLAGGRARIWRDELRRRLHESGVDDVAADTLRRGIRQHVRDIAIFEAIARLVERVRGDRAMLERLKQIDAEERARADVAADPIEAER